MNRSLRRHPVEAKPSKRPVTRVPARTTPQRTASAGRRGLPRVFRSGWLEETVSELRKVTWPTWETTIYLASVVLVVSIIMGLLLGGVDLAFGWIIERLLFR